MTAHCRLPTLLRIVTDRPLADNCFEMIPTLALPEIKKAFEQCQLHFPTIQLPFEDYIVHVEEIVAGLLGLPPTEFPECEAWLAVFAQLHHEDLFLALSCSRGNHIAWEYFADDYLPILQRHAVQACRNLNESQDLAQEIIARMMEDKGKLAGYNGRASLAGWLRIAVSHAAIDRFRRARRQVSLDELEEPQRAAAATDQGSEKTEERMDARWGPVLSQVLADEIRRLPPRDRLMLNLYYLQGVPLKVIGRRFDVHEATASRWLENLRNAIRKRIEKELRTRHGLRPREIRSLWHWVSEDEGFSIRGVLQK